jgi:hypothetical protein
MEETVGDVVCAPDSAAPIVWSSSPACRTAMLSIGYVALYAILDRLSFIGALHGVGITPWNPTAGLAMGVLIVKGLRCAPLVLAAERLCHGNSIEHTLIPSSPCVMPLRRHLAIRR